MQKKHFLLIIILLQFSHTMANWNDPVENWHSKKPEEKRLADAKAIILNYKYVSTKEKNALKIILSDPNENGTLIYWNLYIESALEAGNSNFENALKLRKQAKKLRKMAFEVESLNAGAKTISVEQ